MDGWVEALLNNTQGLREGNEGGGRGKEASMAVEREELVKASGKRLVELGECFVTVKRE